MRKITKKAAAFLLAVCTGATLLLAGLPKLQAKANIAGADMNAPVAPSAVLAANTSAESPLPFCELTGEELTQEMGAGINLGNTMDGHTGFTPGETVWQNVKTTKKLIQSYHDMGFNTIRVPVTWGTMIDDENGYTINEAWMSRVQDIVDYAVSQDMYVIINIHHDGAEQSGWLRIATKDKTKLYQKFGAVWKNIAGRFKNYDEHLIFEAMNEVQGTNMTLAQENAVIMNLNQIFVDTVRNTGANNAKRWLVVCGKYNMIWSLVNEDGGFMLPRDTVPNRLILSAHCYTTWDFCGTENLNTTTYTPEKLKSSNENELSQLERFTSQGIPVIIGEYGCINKNNTEDRALFIEGMNRLFGKYHLIGIYWDQGWYDRGQSPDYSFTIVDRNTGKPVEKEVTDALFRGFFGGKTDLETLERSPEITEITAIEIKGASVGGTLIGEALSGGASADELNLTVGDSCKLQVAALPAGHNDVVLYRTDDAAVATVYNGTVRARGIGQTTITVFSQSGSAQRQISVKVNAAPSDVPCEEIRTDANEYALYIGEYAYLNAQTAPSGCSASLSYRSSDESVATVSTIGKIVAIEEGNAVITVTSSDGFSKEIPVTVTDKALAAEITLALNVYYNDSAHNYFSNEVSSQTITLDSPGQYTLTFDCATDLSGAAKKAGVSALRNLTAIYIKDYDVTAGNTSVSPLETCDILYDEIKVNGQALTITQKTPKSALKGSGIFDTNDPMNSWDGSAVEEVKCSGNVLNFTTAGDPVTVEVTFTLSNMKFNGQEKLADVNVGGDGNKESEGTGNVDNAVGTDEGIKSGGDNAGDGATQNPAVEDTPKDSENSADGNTNANAASSQNTPPENSEPTSAEETNHSNFIWVIIIIIIVFAIGIALTAVIAKKKSGRK